MHDAIAAVTRLILAHSTLFLDQMLPIFHCYQVPICCSKNASFSYAYTYIWNLLIRTFSGPAIHVVSDIERLSSFRGDFHRVCIQEYFWLVLSLTTCR